MEDKNNNSTTPTTDNFVSPSQPKETPITPTTPSVLERPTVAEDEVREIPSAAATEPQVPDVTNGTQPASVTPDEPTAIAPAEDVLSSPTDANPQTVDPVTPPKKSHKLLLLFIILILLVAIGAGAYVWLNRTSTTKSAATAEIVKKDIPNIRYVAASYGWTDFYPAIDDSANDSESNIMTFEGLVRFDNKTQIVPLLATGWSNPDNSTWVFNIRSGVKFHGGRTMTPEDIKLSFDAAKDSNIGQLLATTIKSVEVTGPNQVTIKTDGPDPTLLKKLTLYYVYDTKSGKQNDAVNGTGPFTLKTGTTPKPNSLDLVAFDSYWGGRPHVRSFTFIGIEDYDHGKAYADGTANLESMYGDKPTAVTARKYTQQELDQSSVYIMPLNTRKPGTPLAKLQVRQAIQLALDPAAIAKVRNTNAIPASQIVPSSIPGYDPTITRPARNIAKAKELLTQAGYPKGFSFELTYFKPSQSTADEITKELAEAGITIKEDPQSDPSTLIKKAQTSGLADSFIVTFTSDIFDASDVLGTYGDTVNYKNPEALALLAKAGSTLDSTKRLSYLKQASHVMATDLGIEPIFVQSGDSIIFDPSFVIQRDVASNTIGVYFQKVYAK